MSAEGANQTNSDLDYLRCEDGVSWLWHFLVNLRKKEKEVFVEFFIQFVLSVCLYDIGPTSTLQRIETVWKLTLHADMGVTYPHFWNPKDLQSPPDAPTPQNPLKTHKFAPSVRKSIKPFSTHLILAYFLLFHTPEKILDFFFCIPFRIIFQKNSYTMLFLTLSFCFFLVR